jgi:two-component system phosphate regulon sensor histidine kinase PhoR
MSKRRSQFPRQLFIRFATTQALFALMLFAILYFGIKKYVNARLATVDQISGLPSLLDQDIFWLAIGLPIFVACISMWIGHKLLLPLGHILTKTQSIITKDRAVNLQNELANADAADAGEWSTLELALNQIQGDLESQNKSLLREREEIEAIISAISDPVVAVDPQTNLLFFNTQFLLRFGLQKNNQQQLRLSESIRSPAVLEAFQNTVSDGASRSVSIATQPHSDAPSIHYTLSVAALRQRQGEAIYGAVGVFHDVTELKRAEQIRIDFVANVSHELRTPLTSIKGYTQTLRADAVQPAAKYLETIERNVDRLIFLVTDLLNLSALESGTALEKNILSVTELTERVLSQLETKRQEKEQTITTRFIAKHLQADGRRVEQVLFNLVENAIKYAPRNKNINVTWDQTANNEITLHVVDNGPGIDPEHHPRLFERFYRVDPARTRDTGGTGLGLAIVKHIMQRHGGSVKVQSALPQGTEFICTFPTEHT